MYKRQVLYCRSINSIAEQINGILKKGYTKEALKTLLGLLTFNKLTKIILVDTGDKAPAIKHKEQEEDDNGNAEDTDVTQKHFKRSDILRIQCRYYNKTNINKELLNNVSSR